MFYEYIDIKADNQAKLFLIFDRKGSIHIIDKITMQWISYVPANIEYDAPLNKEKIY